MLIQAAGGVLPAGAPLRSLVRDGSAATTSKVELQQPPNMFCNFLKGLAKNTFRVYYRSAVYSCRVIHLFFIGRQAGNHRREC